MGGDVDALHMRGLRPGSHLDRLRGLKSSFTKRRHLVGEPLTRAESTGMFAIHRRTLSAIGTVILVAASVFASNQTFADDGDILRVYMNSARILKLDRPVSKVIIGNSDVADATVADARTIVVTGRSYGSTNIVLLDSDGNALLDERIVVSIDE